jgi:hypothetical protein
MGVRLSLKLFWIAALGGTGVACASAYVAETSGGADASTLDTGAPVDSATPDGTAGPTDAGGSDRDIVLDAAPIVTFSDDFERSDGAIVPPWDDVTTRNGRLYLAASDAGSRVLTSETDKTADPATYAERAFENAPVRRATVRFVARLVDFDPGDAGSGETAALFTLRLETAPTDSGPGPEHNLRVGLKRKTASTFTVFVMSQTASGGTRTADSNLVVQTRGRYAIRLEADVTTPQAGKPMMTAYVDDVPAVSLDGAGESVHDYVPTGRFFFPGAITGGGFKLELDDLSFVGRR